MAGAKKLAQGTRIEHADALTEEVRTGTVIMVLSAQFVYAEDETDRWHFCLFKEDWRKI